MLRRRIALLAASILLASSALAADRWLHVRVEEGDGERVRVNIPLSLVEKVLPLVESEELKQGKVRIGEQEMGNTDLRRIWEAVRATEDAEFVTVQGPRENVRVAKAGNFLVVKATEGTERKETVNVRVPLRVVDALFSGDSDELDIVAAVRALGAHDDGDLVTVDDGDSKVRIWVDSAEQGQ
jgi:hypothetical protein